MMLQQTQVSRVIPKYKAWLKQFPTVSHLAKASGRQVLNAWSGLGYNRRALLLREAARVIVKEHRGRFPNDREILQSLPGIGRYTSGAINIFAHNKNEVCLDTNIRRVLISELGLPKDISEKELYRVAEHVLPHGRSRNWHNALMDYGALIATSRRTGVKPVTTQSKFQGSLRQVRGAIVRLLTQASATETAIYLQGGFPRAKTKRALKSLLADKIVERPASSRYALVR